MVDYYQENFFDYHRETFSVDSSFYLNSFAARLPEGASILDVGCGSGRDLLWLKKRGFQVAGLERSAGLAALARENAGCKVIEGDFETYDFRGVDVDAILASGSLVHIPHGHFSKVIRNIQRALVRNGWIYISLKKGSGVRTDSTGRVFYLWEDVELQAVFKDLNFKLLHSSCTRSLLKTTDRWLGYVLQA